MASNIYTIPVDIKLRQTSIVPKFIQYDNGILKFSITDNGQSIDLTGITKSEITLKRVLDNVVFVENMTLQTEGSLTYFTYEFKGSEMSKVGTMEVVASIFFGQTSKITTLPIKIEIVDDLQGGEEILATQEVSALRRLINEVEGLNETVTNSENLREENELQRQIDHQQRMDDVDKVVTDTKYNSPYNNAVQYKMNNVVSFNGSSYMAKQDTLGNPPPTDHTVLENTYWGQVGRKGADGNGTVVRRVQKFVSTANQTTFNLSNSYTQFTGMIDVEIEGIPQYSPDNFIELSPTSIQFTEPLVAGLEVVVKYFSEAQPVTSDLQTTVTNHTTTISDHEVRIQNNTVQLAEKATKEEVNVAIGNISDGTPLQADNVAGMTDVTRLYVNTTDGLLYRHNGTTFVSTGIVYTAIRLQDGSVTPEKTDFLTTGKNIFNRNNVKDGFLLSSSGNETANASYAISNYMPALLNTPVRLSYGTVGSRQEITSNRIVLYDANFNKLETISSFASGQQITNPAAKYWRVAFTKTVADNFLQIEYGTATPYEAYKVVFKNETTLPQQNITNLNDLMTSDKSTIVGAINEVFNRAVSISGLSDKIIVCFGDSITEFGNYPEVISQITGATVYNVGFGGTRLARHPTADYDAFSMYRLTDAIISGDWTLQDAAVGVQPAYATILALLKSIDFANVDIITINHGTNDFSGGVAFGDINSPVDGQRFYGALKYIIQAINTAYPHIQIVFFTPAWRARFSVTDPAPATNSDVYPRPAGEYLIQFADAMIEVSNRYHLPCYDTYRNLGVNEFNYTRYLADGLHPSAPEGFELWGTKFAKFLLATV